MYKKGFTVLNSPLLLHTWCKNEELNMEFSNDEKMCCISHEDFTVGEIVVKFAQSKSVLKEFIFYDYIRQMSLDSPRYSSLISGDWSLTCPVSGMVTHTFSKMQL